MSFLSKSSFINCFKRFPLSFYSHNEFRLCAYHSIYFNPLGVEPRVLNASKDRKISLIPDRKIMNSYFAYYVQRKVENAFDYVRFLRRGEERLLGFKWFNTLQDVDYEKFLILLEMPDTFYSWFKIIELHTWMMLLYLPQRNRGHEVIRIGLINALWIDTEKRSEILAPRNANFKKNMRTLYERFQVSLFLYDDAYFNTDKELSSAIWYNFFEKENIDPRLLEVLVSYIRYQVHYLYDLKITPEQVNDENLKLWTPLQTHYDRVFQMH